VLSSDSQVVEHMIPRKCVCLLGEHSYTMWEYLGQQLLLNG
jgi:hypothetical protein